MASRGYKLATGFVEIKLGDETIFVRATQQAVRRVAADAERVLSSRLSRALNTVSTTITNLGVQASLYLAPLSLAVGDLARKGWDIAKSVDQAVNMYQQFGLSAQEANAFVRRLYQDANAWGVEYNSVLTTSMRLMGIFSGDAQRVAEVMGALANLTGKYHLNQDQANRVFVAFVQMWQKGKVGAEEMTQQMGEVIPAWEILGKATGKTVQDLQNLSQKGQLLSQDVLPKLVNYLNTDPDFAGRAIANANTLQGQLNILHNQMNMVFGGAFLANNEKLLGAFKNLNTALLNLSNSGAIERFLTPLIDGFARLLNWISQLSPTTQMWIAKALLIGAVLGPILLVIGKLIGLFGQVSEKLGKAGAALKSWAFNTDRGVRSSVRFGRAVDSTFRAVNSAGQALIHPITSVRLGLLRLGSGFRTAQTTAYVFASNALDKVRSGVSSAVSALGTLKTAVGVGAISAWDALRSGVIRAGDALRHFGTWAGVTALGALERLKSAAHSTQVALANGLSRACDLAARGVKRLGSAAGSVAQRGFGAMKIGVLGLFGVLGTVLLQNDAFRASVENLATAIATALGGPLADVINTLTTALQPVLPIIAGLLAQVAAQFVSLIEKLTPVLVPALQQLATILSGSLAFILPLIANALVALLGALGPVIPVVASLAATLLGALLPPLSTLFSTLSASLGPVLPIITSAIQQLFGAFVEIVPIVVQFGVQLLQILIPPAVQIIGIFGQVLSALRPLMPPFTQIISLVVQLAAQFIGALLPAVTPIIGVMLNLLSSVLRPLMPVITKLAELLAGALAVAFRVLQPVVETIAGAFRRIVDVVQSVIGTIGRLVDKVRGAAGAVKNFLGGLNPFAAPMTAEFSLLPSSAGSMMLFTAPAPMALASPASAISELSAPVGMASGSLSSLERSVSDLQGSMAEFGRSLRQQLRVPAFEEDDRGSRPSPAAPQITVNAQTNANPYEIGREIAWQLKTSGR
ncbi:hypothetical protein GCM10012275_08080 [Longimycelium tulufanense]|uniref:Tape measure protein N-terminal domain-containing protein n=1 Tax=Longimycelium tulufanense TaxID=907463 RepID=A0A8J3FUY8_9PSEU|nr:tape measure protein [Longimycelium tulufanense]GGM39593.1 hypothetical protein GCM10012275_08080 [Longimycelium tulufanense]